MPTINPSEQRLVRCQSAPPTFGAADNVCAPPERSTSAPPSFEASILISWGKRIIAARAPGVTLSSLPVELRAMIFEHVLVVSQEIKILPSRFEGKELETPADQKPEQVNIAALLLVDKSTHSETKKILYGRNTFSFSIGIVENLNASAFRGFLDSVVTENLACIQRIAISPYLPRRAWAGTGRRGGNGGELEGMAQAVVQRLTGVQEVELNLDGPYGPPVLRGPVVDVEEGSDNLQKVVGAVRILEGHVGMTVHLRAGQWLDMRKVEAELRGEEFT